MATIWDKVYREVAGLNRPDAIDEIRRQKMERVQQLTGRALVVYAVDFPPSNIVKSQIVASEMLITLSDKGGFGEVTRDLNCDEVDILLHSPGGSAEATESIVAMLRARFKHIRFIVPSVAKSAATMLAMSGDAILMDYTSELGPIDPQMLVTRDNQMVYAPAQTIKDQFTSAQKEIMADQNKLPVWVPILRQYGPSLLAECDNHLKLAETLVATWLAQYMFASSPEAKEKAERVAKYLNNHNHFLSHGRRVGIAELQAQGLNILDMRTTPEVHRAIEELFASIQITFDITGAYKIFENHQRDALVRMIVVQPQEQKIAPQPKGPSPQKKHKRR